LKIITAFLIALVANFSYAKLDLDQAVKNMDTSRSCVREAIGNDIGIVRSKIFYTYDENLEDPIQITNEMRSNNTKPTQTEKTVLKKYYNSILTCTKKYPIVTDEIQWKETFKKIKETMDAELLPLTKGEISYAQYNLMVQARMDKFQQEYDKRTAEISHQVAEQPKPNITTLNCSVSVGDQPHNEFGIVIDYTNQTVNGHKASFNENQIVWSFQNNSGGTTSDTLNRFSGFIKIQIGGTTTMSATGRCAPATRQF